MMNLRRLALVSGIAVLSAVAFAPNAQAQTANVDFTGSTSPTCTVNSTTAGALVLSAVNGPNDALRASSTVGTPGILNISCSAGTTFKISSITDNGTSGGATFATTDYLTAGVRDGATSVAKGDVSPNGAAGILNPMNTAGAVQTGPITNKNYSVDLLIQKIGGAALPAGNYKVRIGVALTPQ